eukprot:m.242785 g.242785  ORF g.242785 m.242785 type:complete len:366 (-) comp26220_c0_seq1:223-1320(-)
MPLIVRDYSWEETLDTVVVTVPLNGVPAAKVDIYSNDVFIKASFPPFLCEIDLLEPVRDSESSATLGNGVAIFRLTKAEPRTWGTLCFTGDKDTIAQRRAAAQERHQEHLKGVEEAKRQAVRESEQMAVRKQMEIEAQQRAALQQAKKTAVDKVVAGMDEQFAVASSIAPAAPSKGAAPVRAAGKIAVSFTPREFRTPLREEYREQEEEWLARQAEARAAVQRAKERDPTAVDSDPLWLVDRGKEFYSKGDIQSAINAFTEAVTIDPSCAPAYSNRGACHLRRADPQACAADCSKALSLLQPPCAANAKSRLLALVRRASALAQVDDHEAAASDYRGALELDPTNEELRQHLAETLKKMNLSPSA